MPIETAAGMPALTPDSRVLVTGHRGLVGSAILRLLTRHDYRCIITASREEVDLRDPAAVDAWFAGEQPEFVIHAAGTVGGIWANWRQPVDFLHDNLMLQATVLRSAWKHGVQKLLYLGSSCIYPRDCPQPIREDSLLSGPLEPTNAPYAIAKIAGVTACEAYRRQYGCCFISAMPTNLYGPNDNFDLESAHVLPAMIRRFHEARITGADSVVVWGSGTPRREFLHVDDLAEACLFLLLNYDEAGPINVGTGEDLSIKELAEVVRPIVYPECRVEFDRSKPDGTPRKLLDVSRIHDLGWRHHVSLTDGVRSTYEWFMSNTESS